MFSKPRVDHLGFVFVCVANLVPIKNLDYLITAFSKAGFNRNEVYLNIIGDGQLRNHLEELIVQNDLEDNIHLLGRLSREEISNYLSKSDCFVLPSQSETFGVAYIEALASGIPVIATNQGGPNDFVDEENGILIDPFDIDKLVHAMKTMFYHSQTYNTDTLRSKIRARFSPDSIAKQLTRIYADSIRAVRHDCMRGETNLDNK